jgi:hypothetical protein
MRVGRIRATFAPSARKHAPGRGLQRCSRLRQHQARLVSSQAPVRALVPPRILRGCGVSASAAPREAPPSASALVRAAAPAPRGTAQCGRFERAAARGRGTGAHVFRRRRKKRATRALRQLCQRLLPRRIRHQHGIAGESAADHGPGGLPSGAPGAGCGCAALELMRKVRRRAAAAGACGRRGLPPATLRRPHRGGRRELAARCGRSSSLSPLGRTPSGPLAPLNFCD